MYTKIPAYLPILFLSQRNQNLPLFHSTPFWNKLNLESWRVGGVSWLGADAGSSCLTRRETPKRLGNDCARSTTEDREPLMGLCDLLWFLYHPL